MKTVKELVTNNKVHFMQARKGNLWYVTENEQFEFPVPFEDMGDGIFPAEEKAIFFMRYIRKRLKVLEERDKLNEND